MRKLTQLVLMSLVLAISLAQAQEGSSVTPPRIYIFENGHIRGLDPGLFNFRADELAEVDFVNTSYLIVHPDGELMFEASAVADSMSDHTANANAFANAKWIVQQAERDFMFADDSKGIMNPATYNALRDAETIILENKDMDVFGDGSVTVMSTPGHTPGHQVLAVRLANAGMVLLGGDHYHYPEERTTGRVPTFEFSPEQSRVSRARIEALLEEAGGTLWIEHDIATHDALPKAPQYVD